MIVQLLARGFAYRQRAVCEGLESPRMFFDVFRTDLNWLAGSLPSKSNVDGKKPSVHLGGRNST